MRRFMNVAVISLLAVAGVLAWAQKDVPYGWHRIEIEGKPDAGLQADFDGDGKPDTVVILADDNGRSGGLFVFASSASRWIKLDSGKVAVFQARRAAIARPGEFRTACEKPKDDQPSPCSKDDSAELRLAHPGIELSDPSGTHVLFYWDAETKAFKKALLAN